MVVNELYTEGVASADGEAPRENTADVYAVVKRKN